MTPYRHTASTGNLQLRRRCWHPLLVELLVDGRKAAGHGLPDGFGLRRGALICCSHALRSCICQEGDGLEHLRAAQRRQGHTICSNTYLLLCMPFDAASEGSGWCSAHPSVHHSRHTAVGLCSRASHLCSAAHLGAQGSEVWNLIVSAIAKGLRTADCQ